MKEQPELSSTVNLTQWLTKAWAKIHVGVIPAILALYLNTSLVIWGLILLDIATGSFNMLTLLRFSLPTGESLALLKLALYAAIGGAVGGILYGMQNLWKHTAAGDFEIVYIGDYVFRQFGSAALSVVIFALIRGGILSALGADPSAAQATPTSSFSTFAIGALAGFGSYQVTERINELIKQLFGKSTTDTRSSQPATAEDDTKAGLSTST